VLHVQTAVDLVPAWFQPFATVGLTAGTSTLPDTIDEVHRALVWIGSGSNDTDSDRPFFARDRELAANLDGAHTP
jgi:4-hydroxy-3-methylbut-2-enyl diphosphate reductase IspH